MPTRIVREGIVSSESINRLSPAGEVFYKRLMNVADDYGRYFAHPSLLRGACYALQLDRISDKDVSRALAECVAEKLIFIYGGGKYLQVVKFNQQRRAKSKFPEPSESELLINCESVSKPLLTQSDNSRLDSDTTPTTHTTPTPKANGHNFKFPEILKTESFQETWAEWVRHLKEKRCKTTPLAFEKQIKKCAGWGVERALAAINYSIEHNWQGIYEARAQDDHLNHRAGTSKPIHPKTNRDQYVLKWNGTYRIFTTTKAPTLADCDGDNFCFYTTENGYKHWLEQRLTGHYDE